MTIRRDEKESLNKHLYLANKLIIIKGIFGIGRTYFIKKWKEEKENLMTPRDEHNNVSLSRKIHIVYHNASQIENLENLVSEINKDIEENMEISTRENSDPFNKFEENMKRYRNDDESSIYIIIDNLGNFISDEDINIVRSRILNVLHTNDAIIILPSSKYDCKSMEKRIRCCSIRIKSYRENETKEVFRDNLEVNLDAASLIRIHKICRGHHFFIQRSIEFAIDNNRNVMDPNFEDALREEIMNSEFKDAFTKIDVKYSQIHSRSFLADVLKKFLECDKKMDGDTRDFGGIDEGRITANCKDSEDGEAITNVVDFLKQNEEFRKYLEEEENCIKLYPPFIECLYKYMKPDEPIYMKPDEPIRPVIKVWWEDRSDTLLPDNICCN